MAKLSIEVNKFDDWGRVIGTKTVEMTKEQIADVVGHAAQLIAVHRASRRSSGDMDGIIEELDEAMYATDIFDEQSSAEENGSDGFEQVFSDVVSGLVEYYPILKDEELLPGLKIIAKEQYVETDDPQADYEAMRNVIEHQVNAEASIVIDDIANRVRRIQSGGHGNPIHRA